MRELFNITSGLVITSRKFYTFEHIVLMFNYFLNDLNNVNDKKN